MATLTDAQRKTLSNLLRAQNGDIAAIDAAFGVTTDGTGNLNYAERQKLGLYLRALNNDPVAIDQLFTVNGVPAEQSSLVNLRAALSGDPTALNNLGLSSLNFASLFTSPYFVFQADQGFDPTAGTWADQSGNGRNASYDTNGTKPTAGTGVNGRASVVVGASSGMLFPCPLPAPGTTPFSVVLMVKANSWTSGNLLFAGADAVSPVIKQAGTTPQIAQAVTAQTQAGNLTLGSFFMVVATFTNSASDSLRIGSAAAASGSNSGNASGEATYALGFSFNRGPGFAGEILLAAAYPGTVEPAGLRTQALSYWAGINA